MKNRLDLTKFEALEASGEVLKGGFSSTFTGLSSTGGNESGNTNVLAGCGTTTNTNCAGANCVAGCGSPGNGGGAEPGRP